MKRIRQIFCNQELRKRLLFTLFMLCIHRLGMHIPVPGVNLETIGKKWGAEYLINAMDMVSGGALKEFSIFALGIAPYITASIVLQLISVAIPTLENLQKKEGEVGRAKINQWTRYLTVLLAIMQGFGFAQIACSNSMTIFGITFKMLLAIMLTTGSIFVMWLGEQITDRGIGNGVSIIIFAGIVAKLPRNIYDLILKFKESLDIKKTVTPPGVFLVLLAIILIILLAVVFMETSYRHIPIHYARRIDSHNIVSQLSSYLPLRVNTAGVMPVIFAGSIINFPSLIANFTKINWLHIIAESIKPDQHLLTYVLVLAVTIMFFAFFYTSIVFNPDETADNIKKSGGYIPGIRPGKETSIYMDNILTKLTFIGAIYLTLVSIAPLFIMSTIPGFNFFYGGTSLLIVVGVALDTIAQLDGYHAMCHYEGFLEKGRINRRRFVKTGGRTR